MSRIRMLSAAAILCGLGWALTSLTLTENAAAQGKEKKKPNMTEPPKGVKDNDKTRALEDLMLAHKLIQYGRKEKSAASLLLAAQILHKTPTEKIKVKATVEGEKGEKAPEKTDNTPKALVAEAKKMSKSETVEMLAKATMKVLDEEPRDRVGGPGVDAFVIYPNQTRTWKNVNFIGGLKAEVVIDNGIYGRMILEVFDEFGNQVARDSVPGSFYRCVWYPSFTGPFTIRLSNIDTISFRCGMATN